MKPNWLLSLTRAPDAKQFPFSIRDERGFSIAYLTGTQESALKNGNTILNAVKEQPAMLDTLELCAQVLQELGRLDDGTPSISALHQCQDHLKKNGRI